MIPSPRCGQHSSITVLFVLIWALGRYSCNLILACFHLACSAWGIAQKCPKRTTLSPLFPRLKGFQRCASSFQLSVPGGFEPAKVVVEQIRHLKRFSQPGRLYSITKGILSKRLPVRCLLIFFVSICFGFEILIWNLISFHCAVAWWFLPFITYMKAGFFRHGRHPKPKVTNPLPFDLVWFGFQILVQNLIWFHCDVDWWFLPSIT